MIISIYSETTLDKIQHHFTINSFNKLDIAETYHNTIMAIFDKPTANVILSRKKNGSFIIWTETGPQCSVSQLLLNIVLKVLARTIGQEEEKSIQVETKEVYLSVFADNMVTHVQKPKDFTKKHLELIHSLKLQNTK